MNSKPTYEELERRIQELENAASELEQSRHHLDRMRNILSESQRIANIGSFEYIAATQETVWSDEEFRIYGLDPADGSPLYQDMLEKNIHPDDSDLLDRTFKNAFENQEIYELTHKIIRPDGTVRIVHDVAHPYFDDDGNLYRYVGVTLDITERKLAEEKLKQANILLESSIESARDMVILSLDHEYRYLFFNKVHAEVMRRSYGTSPQIGDCIFDHVTVEEDAEKLRDHYDRALAGDGHTAIGEYGEDQLRYYFEVQYNPIYDDSRNIVGLTAFAQDITDRKMAELQQAEIQQHLTERNRFIEMILNFLPIGLGVNYIDSGEVTYLNKQFAETYGWSKSDFKNVMDFFEKVFPDPEKREMLREKILNDINSRDPERMIWENLEITTQNGENRIVTAQNIPIFEQNLMISTAQDVTEKRELEAQLQHSQKLESIGNLAGGIAHEFNNILSIIIGNNELIMDELPEGSQARESSEEIQLAGLRARDVVQQLLTFSRHDTGIKQVLDLGAVVRKTMKLIRSSTPANIGIKHTVSSGVFPVLADTTQMNQLLINLCSNAVDAMPDTDGELAVDLYNETVRKTRLHPPLSPGNYVKLTVRDNGSGVDEKTLGRIFDPYFTTKEVGKGTGIGLAVVHGIVQQHGGSVVADSKPGKGTKITIHLPAYEPVTANEAEREPVCPAGVERILYVDDEPSIAKLGKRHLEKLGYEVEATTDPLQALAMVTDNPEKFDLVISDMAMPGMTGDQLITKILKIRNDLPAIICTGYSSKISSEDAEQIGVAAFLMKPLKKVELAQTVRSALDKAGRSMSVEN